MPIWIQINVRHIFWHNYHKALVNTLLLIALKSVQNKLNLSHFFIVNTIDSVSLKLKSAVLSQNWEEIICLRYQNISSPLNGLDGSKPVDKTLLKVSAKIGEAKSKKELELFNATGFDCDQELREPRKWYEKNRSHKVI